uniref:uncharacterized protein isoform X2 n=1 Tax=Myxine glutinosa TaxID=7769 RepID=UPI00358E2AEF
MRKLAQRVILGMVLSAILGEQRMQPIRRFICDDRLIVAMVMQAKMAVLAAGKSSAGDLIVMIPNFLPDPRIAYGWAKLPETMIAEEISQGLAAVLEVLEPVPRPTVDFFSAVLRHLRTLSALARRLSQVKLNREQVSVGLCRLGWGKVSGLAMEMDADSDIYGDEQQKDDNKTNTGWEEMQHHVRTSNGSSEGVDDGEGIRGKEEMSEGVIVGESERGSEDIRKGKNDDADEKGLSGGLSLAERDTMGDVRLEVSEDANEQDLKEMSERMNERTGETSRSLVQVLRLYSRFLKGKVRIYLRMHAQNLCVPQATIVTSRT